MRKQGSWVEEMFQAFNPLSLMASFAYGTLAVAAVRGHDYGRSNIISLAEHETSDDDEDEAA